MFTKISELKNNKETKQKFYIEYLNKDKKHQKDRIIFDGPDAFNDAKKWGKENLDNFNIDFIQFLESNNINENNDIIKKGLLVFVYKNGNGDATAKGLTSKHDQLLLVGDDVQGPFNTKDGEDYLVLKKKSYNGKEYLHAIPKSILDSGEWAMFGGNFVYTSDSRFPNQYPIPVHDRVERNTR